MTGSPARAAAVAAALATGATSLATAERVRDASLRIELDVPASWHRPGNALRWRNPRTDQLITITRIDSPNRDAWRGRPRFFAAVEAGAVRASGATRVLRRRRGHAGRVPTLDLWIRLRAPDGTRRVLAVRLLLFRHTTISLAIDSPARGFSRRRRHAVRALAASFVPYFAPVNAP